MTRELIDTPLRNIPLVDEAGLITDEWQRAFEQMFYLNRQLAAALDAATGSSSGATVDSEWNTLVNNIKES